MEIRKLSDGIPSLEKVESSTQNETERLTAARMPADNDTLEIYNADVFKSLFPAFNPEDTINAILNNWDDPVAMYEQLKQLTPEQFKAVVEKLNEKGQFSLS